MWLHCVLLWLSVCHRCAQSISQDRGLLKLHCGKIHFQAHSCGWQQNSVFSGLLGKNLSPSWHCLKDAPHVLALGTNAQNMTACIKEQAKKADKEHACGIPPGLTQGSEYQEAGRLLRGCLAQKITKIPFALYSPTSCLLYLV